MLDFIVFGGGCLQRVAAAAVVGVVLSQVFCGLGCKSMSKASPEAAQTVSDPASPDHDCPPAQTMFPRDGWALAPRANYRAYVAADGSIHLHASGDCPTAGWEVALAQRPTRIFPPEHQLLVKPPGGIVAQVITPFERCVKVRASPDQVNSLRVFDAEGRVDVDVAPAPPVAGNP